MPVDYLSSFINESSEKVQIFHSYFRRNQSLLGPSPCPSPHGDCVIIDNWLTLDEKAGGKPEAGQRQAFIQNHEAVILP